MELSTRGAVILLVMSGLVACETASPPARQAVPPRASSAAAEAWVDDALNAGKLIAGGKLLLDLEEKRKSAGDYCSSGQKLIDRGELRLGIREKMKALYLSQTLRDNMLAAECARGLALGYSFAGRFDNAALWADEALGYLRAVGPRARPDRLQGVYAPAYKVKGDVAMHRGDADSAIRYYEQALAQDHAGWRPWVFSALANAEIAKHNFDRASDLLAKADAVAYPSLKPLIRRSRGQLMLAQGRVDEALAYFETAVRGSQAERDPYELIWSQYGVARALARKGQPTQAMAAYRLAVKTSEGVRSQFRSEEYRSGFYADVQAIFDDAIELAFAMGETAEALEMSEHSRARSLLDMMRGRIKLVEGTSAFADAVGKPATVAAIRDALPPDTAVVVYHALPDKTLAWIVRPNGVRGVALSIGRQALDLAVRDLRRQIVGRSIGGPDSNRNLAVTGAPGGSLDPVAQTLYGALIAPLDLRSGEAAIFVPHKALHYLPFAALRGPDGWLIEERLVASAPSASALVSIARRRGRGQEHLLALGNPDLADARLALPGAEREVQDLRKLYPDAEIYTKGEASKEHFVARAPANQVIHVAAHATVDEVDPLYSTLKLAPGANGRSGDLEAHEVYRLDLAQARLIVLSACDTGMGIVSRGDEFFGFKRAFFGAGVRTLLITLWPIVDESTARLMETFYREMRAAPAAEALRRAQLELLRSKDYAQPVFWAPFILVGDWR